MKILITKKKTIWTIVLFLFLMEECFGLINSEDFHIKGLFSYSDIWLIIFILYFGWHAFRCWEVEVNFRFSRIILLLCIMIFVSAVQQNHLTGQSFFLGIRPQRNYLIILLSYFVMRKIFVKKKIESERIFDLIIFIGVFSACIYILQKVVGFNYIFVHTMITNSRNGMRIYADNSVIDLAILLAAYRWSKSLKPRYIIYSLIGLFYILWVSQGRLEFLAIAMAIILGIIPFGKLSGRKIIVIIGVIIVVFIFISSNYADNLWSAIHVAWTVTSQKENTMTIRLQGRELYIKQLLESMRTLLFGCGYPNMFYTPAISKAGNLKNIYLVDNGIFGFLYIYGLVGGITILFLIIKMIKLSWKVYIKTKNSVPFMYICMLIAMGINMIPWFWDSDGTFVLIIMLCILEHEADIKKINCIERRSENGGSCINHT